MKISIPIDSQQGLGGGFTFARNLEKGLTQIGVEVVKDPLASDIAIICGVTMISKETFAELKERGIKTVVRIDNVPRNSRNRGTGTNRLRSFAQKADGVVWQGFWAKNYLYDFIDRDGVILHNGIDLDIFTPVGDSFPIGKPKQNVYLYSRFSRDETKMWEVAWYQYQMIQRNNKDAKLIIIGKFSDDLRNYDFDFFRGEDFDYLGVIENPMELAKLYRSAGYLMATYFNDAFSNTYLEALACGTQLYEPNRSGGVTEMLDLWERNGRGYFSLERMARDYKKYFETL